MWGELNCHSLIMKEDFIENRYREEGSLDQSSIKVREKFKMYQKVKAEKALAEAERAKYDKLKNRNRRGGKDSTPEVFRKPVDIKDDPRSEEMSAQLFTNILRQNNTL